MTGYPQTFKPTKRNKSEREKHDLRRPKPAQQSAAENQQGQIKGICMVAELHTWSLTKVTILI